MNSLKVWVLAIRPKTLPVAIAPVIMAISMAYKDGFFHLPSSLAIILCAVLLQIGVNLANDYFDFKKGADSKERLGPKRVTQSGLISPEKVKRAFTLVFSLAVLFGVYLVYRGGFPIAIVGVLAVISALLYTGGPLPYGYLGFAEIVIFVFFGPVSTYFTYYLLSGLFSTLALVVGFAPGALAVSLYTITSFRDIHQDRKVDKKTLAVRFGYKFSFFQFLFSLFIPFAVPLVLIAQGYSALLIIPSMTVFLSLPVIRLFQKEIDAEKINASIPILGKTLILFSLSFGVLWLL